MKPVHEAMGIEPNLGTYSSYAYQHLSEMLRGVNLKSLFLPNSRELVLELPNNYEEEKNNRLYNSYHETEGDNAGLMFVKEDKDLELEDELSLVVRQYEYKETTGIKGVRRYIDMKGYILDKIRRKKKRKNNQEPGMAPKVKLIEKHVIDPINPIRIENPTAGREITELLREVLQKEDKE